MLMLILTHLMLMSMLKKKKINKKLCLLTWLSSNQVVTDDHDADAGPHSLDADVDRRRQNQQKTMLY